MDEPSAASQSAGQEDASSRGLLDEMEPAQEEDPVDAQPAPAQADAPEEDAPETAESSLPSGQEEAACSQTEEALAADTRSILEQESPEVPEAYAHMPDADSSGSQSEQEPVHDPGAGGGDGAPGSGGRSGRSAPGRARAGFPDSGHKAG